MHIQAYEYVQKAVARQSFNHVIEFGSLNINGTVRPLFNCDSYWGIDLQSGPCVDEVADAATWRTDISANVVVCCEVLEHTPLGPEIIWSAHQALCENGLFIITCATDPRGPHSAKDGGWLREGEYYKNVDPDDIVRWFDKKFIIENMEVVLKRGDLYVTARRI